MWITTMKENGMFYSLTLVFQLSYGANITHVENLYDKLFTNYNHKLFPVLGDDETLEIETSALIIGINKFDEIDGEIDITCVFNLKWTDERLKWTPSEYGGKTSLLIPSSDVWRPMLYLLESFEKIQHIGYASQLVRLHYNGSVKWVPSNVLKVICSVDVTYFPFDSQTCYMSVSSWLYTRDEMRFVVTNTDLDLSLMNSNSQWHVLSGSLSNTSQIVFLTDTITVQINLRRKSDFFVVYIILPVVFLGLINNLVFVMPASSGERTSVAITAFLSFVVSMEMVNNNVPESSSPLAYIFYYILFLLIYSSVTIFLVIMSLRIHDKEGEVPVTVHKITNCLMFWRMKCAKTPVSPKRSSVRSGKDDNNQNELNKENNVFVNPNEITWKIVGKTFDKYCSVILFIVFVLYTVVTFSRLYKNEGL